VPVALSHIFSFTVYARAWWTVFMHPAGLSNWWTGFMHPAGLSKFFKCTSTSLFTGSTFSYKLNIFHEYLLQYVAKSIATCKKKSLYNQPKPYFFKKLL
jgi:hypothetical protein